MANINDIAQLSRTLIQQQDRLVYLEGEIQCQQERHQEREDNISQASEALQLQNQELNSRFQGLQQQQMIEQQNYKENIHSFEKQILMHK